MNSFMRDILAWALTVEVLGLAALPLLRRFFANRQDAALLSRPIGLALVAWAAWALTLLPRIPFDRRLLLGVLLLLAAASYALHRAARRHRPEAAADRFWGPQENRAALLFWGSASLFLILRAAVPEIFGAEKFMDLSFFGSLTRHPDMPPLDPWMSGKTINYYYWGYLLAAVLAKISGVVPLVAYNLALATFAGYTFVAAVCLAGRLSSGSRAAALGAGAATVFAGNLQGALDAWRAPFDKGFDYWHASRVIGKGDTINEFPFFTFFHADLHPHLLAFPYFVAAFAVAHRIFESGPAPPPAGEKRVRGALRSFLPVLLAAFVAGTAIAANEWNRPAMAILLAVACLFRPTGGRRLPSFREAAAGLLLGAVAFLVAINLFRAYHLSFTLPSPELARTSLGSGLLELMGVWGLFLAVLLAALLPAPGSLDEPSKRMRDLALAGAGAVSLGAALVTRRPALAPLLFLALLAGWHLRRALRGRDSSGLFASFLLLLGLAMIAGCELIYFKDSYGQQLQRMNTVFKFYHQAWPLLAVAAALFAQRAWRERDASPGTLRAVLAAAAVLALLYPANAVISRFRQREGPFTLDGGTAFARRSPDDAAAAAWISGHARRGSVLLEATGDPYRDYARISSHTAVPTVLGWANHEGLWRSNDGEVGERAELIRAFYGGADEQAAGAIARKFRIEFVVLGDLERMTYPGADRVAEFLFLEPVRPGGTAVFHVRDLP